MTKVKLLYPFRCHHHELPEGLVIGLPAEMATQYVRLGLAEAVAEITSTWKAQVHAVVQPQETRERLVRRGPRGRGTDAQATSDNHVS